jgi:hypothetical protein
MNTVVGSLGFSTTLGVIEGSVFGYFICKDKMKEIVVLSTIAHLTGEVVCLIANKILFGKPLANPLAAVCTFLIVRIGVTVISSIAVVVIACLFRRAASKSATI